MQKKHYGGLAVFVKESIRKGIKFEPITNSEYIWFKLDKFFFNMEKDIYVCVLYISNSSFAENNVDIFECVETDAAKFSRDGSNLLFCGDINGYTGCIPDYCIEDGDILSSDSDFYIPYVQDIPLNRNNLDIRKTNTRGDNFLDLCKGCKVRILNGRFLGDTLGNFTCFSHTGAPSTIDYMAASVDLLSSIKTFTVNDLNEMSIHCSLSVSITTGLFTSSAADDAEYSSVNKFKWNQGDGENFLLSLQRPSVINDLDSAFDVDLSDMSNINNCAEVLTSVLVDSAVNAKIRFVSSKRKKSNSSQKNKKPFTRNKPWFDDKCRLLKNEHKRLARCIKKDPFDLSLVYDIRRIRKLYKTCKINAKKTYEQNIWNNLDTLQKTNPRKFWKLFSDLKGMNDSHKSNPICMSEWVSHFSKLLNGAFKPDKDLSLHIENYILENREKVFNELNFAISLDEVSKAIHLLKSNKAPGTDGLINEMLKEGISVLLPYLHKLFNQIFISGNYPENWRTNTLSPLHKKGDTHTTGNYRGIAVSSCIPKLFLSILQRRLVDFSDNNNVIPNCQLGYKRKSSTCDHILTLKNLIDKYISRATRTCMYACFVDFKSAFDTVWRRALLYKILKLGVAGNFLNIIENMYSSVYYCVKLDGSLSDPITSNVGVKQGCVLSPLLFNMFLSDLPDIFDSSCDPVNLLDVKLSCLMFADDLIILSESASGLQSALNKLQEYCSKWGLTINIDKTKVVIFNKGGHKFPSLKFLLNGNLVEAVQSYCYLGIIFSSCGSFTRACDALTDKALKAFYKFKQIHPYNNVTLSLKLFDSLVTPIATYAGSVWGVLCTGKLFDVHDLNYYDKAPLEKVNLKLCRYLLGVNKYSCKHAVRGEIGRFPLLINALEMCSKMKSRVFTLPDNNLVKLSCLDMYANLSNTELYDDNSLKDTWLSRTNKIDEISAGMVKLSLQNIYKNSWEMFISNTTVNNKLRTYARFKKSFEMENYVKAFGLSKRKMFTKLRISSHNLAIEKGRHSKIPQSNDIVCDFCKFARNNCTCNSFKYNRLCQVCNVIEDECHFLLKCSLYKNCRQSFLENLKSFVVIDFDNIDEVFIKLMSTLGGDYEISTLICDYVNELFEIREKYMLPVLDNIMNLKPVCTRLNRTIKIPEYLKDYVC